MNKGKRVKKRWVILFALITAISVLGLFVKESAGQFDMPSASLYANVAWLITATIFVLMMTPGLSFFYGGMVRAKNVISTMLQSFIVMGFVSVIWVVFGFSLSFGNDICHVIGNPADFFMFRGVGVQNVMAEGDARNALTQIDLATTTIPLALFALFQMKFAIITPSLITGSFAERVRFSGYLLFMMLWVIFVYCPLAHCTWHPEGLFANMHVHDFAGGIVVHAASGVAALAGALFLGRRTDTANSKPANVPFVLLCGSVGLASMVVARWQPTALQLLHLLTPTLLLQPLWSLGWCLMPSAGTNLRLWVLPLVPWLVWLPSHLAPDGLPLAKASSFRFVSLCVATSQ
jgi:Amt family ammonium transporter